MKRNEDEDIFSMNHSDCMYIFAKEEQVPGGRYIVEIKKVEKAKNTNFPAIEINYDLYTLRNVYEAMLEGSTEIASPDHYVKQRYKDKCRAYYELKDMLDIYDETLGSIKDYVGACFFAEILYNGIYSEIKLLRPYDEDVLISVFER